MGLRKLLHTTTFRLAAVYVVGFAASVAGLGVISYVVTTSALERRLDARMASEMKALQAGDLPQLIATVHALAACPGSLPPCRCTKRCIRTARSNTP